MRLRALRDRYFDWVVAHPWIAIIACLAIVALAGLGLRTTSFAPDSRVYFGENNPRRVALEQLERVYFAANNVLIVVAPRQGTIFTRQGLALVQKLTDEAWKTPYSIRVDSLSNFANSSSSGDDIVISPLYKDAAALTDADLERIRKDAVGNRELVSRLIAPAGDVTAINIVVVRPRANDKEVKEVAEFARAMIARARAAHPEFEFRLTGGLMADVAFAEAGAKDLETLVPIMLVLIVVTLWIAFRSVTAVFSTFVVVVFSVIVAVGAFVGTGTVLNGATGSAPVIIMTICILDAAHVITTMTREMRAGRSKRDAVVESLRVNNTAMFITSLTDVIGFVVLNFAESPPLNELGNMVSLGAAAAYVFSVTLLPALLIVLPTPPHRDHLRLDSAMVWFANIAIARPRRLLAAMSVLAVTMSAGVAFITLDDNFLEYFDRRFEFRRDTDYFQQRLSGLHVVNFSLPSGEDQGIARPDYLKNVDRFGEWLRTQDKVVTVVSFADIIKRLNRSLNGDDPAYFVVGDSRRLNAQLLLLYEMSLPQGRDLRSQTDIAKSSTLMSVVLRNASSSDIQRIGAAGEEWLRRNAPAMATEATGLSVAFAYVSENNIRMMLLGTLVGLTLISLTMFVVLRNARLGWLSLIPNIVPAVMAYGLWGYLFGEVNLAVSVVGSFTFGIIVDDTVHFMAKYHECRKNGATPEDAVRDCFRLAGLPTVVTSAVLIAGFLVLCFSGFAISRDMGMLSAITIFLGLMVELFLLPVLLLTFAGRRRRRA